MHLFDAHDMQDGRETVWLVLPETHLIKQGGKVFLGEAKAKTFGVHD
jgi:hypothetical protein